MPATVPAVGQEDAVQTPRGACWVGAGWVPGLHSSLGRPKQGRVLGLRELPRGARVRSASPDNCFLFP